MKKSKTFNSDSSGKEGKSRTDASYYRRSVDKREDEKRYAASLLTSILGDGNSSRLWQNIREKRGLAYSVGASSDFFDDCGIFSIYAGTSPKSRKGYRFINHRNAKVKRKGVTSDELNLAKEQTIASILLSLESSAARAENLAHNEMVHGRQIPVEETLQRLEAVEIEEIKHSPTNFSKPKTSHSPHSEI